MKKNLKKPLNAEQKELLRDKEEQNKKIWIDHLKKHDNEFKTMTRRELLSAGVISSVGYLAVPSLLSILPQVAQGQVVCDAAAAGPGFIPFLNINLAGGAMMSGNMVVMDQAGLPLANYATVGVNSANFIKDLNGANWNNTSGILAGIRANAVATTLANTTAVIVSSSSNDDSNTNRFSAIGEVLKSGLKGEVLPALGTQNRPTGVGSVASGIVPPAPLVVRSVNDITGAVNVVGPLATFSVAQKTSLFNTISKLSNSQVRRLAGLNAAQGLDAIVECAGIKNTGLVQNAANLALNVTQNAALNAIFPNDAVNGSIIMNILNGNAPCAGIDLGGYDYHGNPRATTDARDNQAGVLIGRALQAAAILQKPLFIHVTSDGSVSCDANGNPASDSGTRGAAYMIIYDPVAAPKINGTVNQLGFMTAAQTGSTATTVGSAPDKAAAAVFANWAFYSTGNQDLFNKVSPGRLTAAQLAEVTIFRK